MYLLATKLITKKRCFDKNLIEHMLNNKRRFLMDFYTVCVFERKKIHKKMLITLNSMKCVFFFHFKVKLLF